MMNVTKETSQTSIQHKKNIYYRHKFKKKQQKTHLI
jgi:hypothetical protein